MPDADQSLPVQKSEFPDQTGTTRLRSGSQASEQSQTAAEFINSQLALEAEAREALPYAFDSCTQPLGALRQIVFSCLTCNPPPSDTLAPYPAAGICYSCSIACHGDHELVEIFNKRNFICDCGTTRLPASAPCTLRINAETDRKGGVHSEEAALTNHYDQNFANRFCGCERVYDAHKQKGTMFQCLGLGYAEDGGCGEDWWHPGCLTGDGPDWGESQKALRSAHNGAVESDEDEDFEENLPPGFPKEEAFESFICYKCVDANPWIRDYASSAGFLAPVIRKPQRAAIKQETDAEIKSEVKTEIKAEVKTEIKPEVKEEDQKPELAPQAPSLDPAESTRKRKAEDELDVPSSPKKVKAEDDPRQPLIEEEDDKKLALPYHTQLSPAPADQFSLFLREDFRDHFCRCAECFPRLSRFPQLLEEEDVYEPPASESDDGAGGSSAGTASLLDRGERALNNIDRVRAIEGVMAYNHLKEKVKTFLKPFADSGEAVGADDVKKYFEQLRGDAEAIREANSKAALSGQNEDDNEEGGYKREQSGY